MAGHVSTVLILICLLQIKHMFADYFLQTPRMLEGRSNYWHLGRAEHAGVHVLGSIIALLLVGAPMLFILVLVVIEWVVHFNIDWAKARYSEKKGFGPYEAGYWRANGFDQALHQLTYVAMAWAFIEFA
ncbi:DUF3307 domain-containing protein [Seohaeicola zhoushanensis]|uniref:DUF3307 domain-containing protein n=1 Tax=Seohaeicola zhoushanensis TaxID=1569283 RepID=UPI001E5E6BED|nr:DUF3307 domain-containing protein [Seohaeicola zhoushanensis]